MGGGSLGICQPLQNDTAPWGYLWKALDLMSIVSNALPCMGLLARVVVQWLQKLLQLHLTKLYAVTLD